MRVYNVTVHDASGIHCAVNDYYIATPQVYSVVLTQSTKCKAIPVTGRGEPLGCETSILPYSVDNRLTVGGEIVSLMRQPRFTLPRKMAVRG
jgi:hypothetical protein